MWSRKMGNIIIKWRSFLFRSFFQCWTQLSSRCFYISNFSCFKQTILLCNLSSASSIWQRFLLLGVLESCSLKLSPYELLSVEELIIFQLHRNIDCNFLVLMTQLLFSPRFSNIGYRLIIVDSTPSALFTNTSHLFWSSKVWPGCSLFDTVSWMWNYHDEISINITFFYILLFITNRILLLQISL